MPCITSVNVLFSSMATKALENRFAEVKCNDLFHNQCRDATTTTPPYLL